MWQSPRRVCREAVIRWPSFSWCDPPDGGLGPPQFVVTEGHNILWVTVESLSLLEATIAACSRTSRGNLETRFPPVGGWIVLSRQMHCLTFYQQKYPPTHNCYYSVTVHLCGSLWCHKCCGSLGTPSLLWSITLKLNNLGECSKLANALEGRGSKPKMWQRFIFIIFLLGNLSK